MKSVARYRRNNPEEEDTTALAHLLAPLLRSGDLLILSGELAAGKTFFTRALCHGLGLAEEEPVTSPTYTLVHEIPTVPKVIHADLYRLQGSDDVRDLGLEELRQSGCILVVEWGNPFVDDLGGDAIYLHLEVEPRIAELSGDGERAQQIVETLRASGEGSQ